MVSFQKLLLACAVAAAPLEAQAATIDLEAAGYERTATEYSFSVDVICVFGTSLIVSDDATGSGFGGANASDVATYTLNLGGTPDSWEILSDR